MEDNEDIVPAEPETQSSPRRSSCWRKVGYTLLFIFGVLSALLLFLTSGYGQRSTLMWAQKWLDGLHIERVEGSLQEGLVIQQVEYQRAGVEARIGMARLHINFGCLWQRSVCVEEIALSESEIRIDSSQLPPSPKKSDRTLSPIRLPIPMELRKLSLDKVRVAVDETEIDLAHFHTALYGRGERLSVAPTELVGLHISLGAQAPKKSEKSAKSEKSVPPDWQALEKRLSQALLNRAEPIRLPLQLELEDFQAKDIQLVRKGESAEKRETLLTIKQAVLQGRTDNQAIQLKRLEIDSDKGRLNGQGEIALNGNYPLKTRVQAVYPAYSALNLPAGELTLHLEGTLFGTTVLQLANNGELALKLTGQIQPSEPKTPFVLHLQSERLRLPWLAEKGQSPLSLSALDLKLQGNLLDYKLDGSVNSSGMNLPDGSLVLRAQGGLTQLALTELRLNALNGEAHLSGQLGWANGLEWQSRLKLNGIETRTLLPEWQALLSGSLSSRGYAMRGEAQAWQVEFDELDLQGQLEGRKLSLHGKLSSDPKTRLNVPTLSLIYGENRLNLNGILDDKADLRAEINAPDLGGLIPHLKAGIRGKLNLQGKLAQPTLALDLVAENVAYQQFKLQRLSLAGQVASETQITGNLSGELAHFSHNDIRIERAQLNLQGAENSHHLTLRSQGEPLGLDMQLSGNFDRLQQRWKGILQSATLHSEFGTVRNTQAVDIQYENAQRQVSFSAHCWQHTQVSLCFPRSAQVGEEGRVPFEIKRLDLALINPHLAKTTQLEGVLNAKGEALWFKQKMPQVELEVGADLVRIVQQLDSRRFPLTLKPLKLNARLNENTLTLETDLVVENNGRLHSNLLLQDLSGRRALSGKLGLDQLNIALLKPLLSTEEQINGEINADLKLGGTLLDPQLFGRLTLRGLNAKSAVMPFVVKGGGLTLNFNGTHSTLDGEIKTEESKLNLVGEADWRKTDAWYSRIQAQANRFRLDLPGIAKVDVSPNIEVKITPSSLMLGGSIDIPWARIEVQELPESAVSVSNDEVIMDGKVKKQRSLSLLDTQNLPKKGQGMALSADVSVNIGNDVRLEAYGLKTNLNGALKVRQGSRGLGLYGQVNLNNGIFASFGQDLIIRKGLISFTGLPSQPTLDIEAIRNPEAMEDTAITAGVKVTGIADHLDVNVFSSPAMAQDQALSYLLTGRGLGSGDGASGNSVAAALIGLGLSKSSKTVGSVGSAFGISDLNVTTAGIGDNTKVVVSGNLTPKFNVKYGVGLFAPLTELTLRYRLAPRLYLQWVSSINQAVDLLYRFEFD